METYICKNCGHENPIAFHFNSIITTVECENCHHYFAVARVYFNAKAALRGERDSLLTPEQYSKLRKPDA